MTTHTLRKKSDDHLLAHLYEHIYFMHLDTELRDLGFFSIVDYSIDAYTEDGEVVFDIELYADIDIEAAIAEASSSFLSISELLDIGMAQIECEYGKSLELQDVEDVRRALVQFNEVAWNSTLSYQPKNGILALGGALDTKKHRLIFDYDGVEAPLRPLYRQVAGLTLNTMISDVADTHGGFVDSEAYTSDDEHNLVGTLILKGTLDRSILEVSFLDTIEELRDKGGYKRLLDMLRDVEALDNPPSAERTFQDTGIMMSPDDWRDLATQENLDTLLRLLHFEVK